VTLLLSFTLLHEKFSMLQWFGAALIGASLVLVGFDHYTPEKRAHTGILAWLNAPRISPLNLPWQK
jgi:drug/metabolite transporter (DMT)-like permease